MESTWQVSDLVGCRVVTVDGREIGVFFGVIRTGSNDVFVVRRQEAGVEKEILVPALKTVVLNVSIEKKEITVTLPPGLEEIDQKI